MSEQIHSPSASYFVPGSTPMWSLQTRFHCLCPDSETLPFFTLCPDLCLPFLSGPCRHLISQYQPLEQLSVPPARIQLPCWGGPRSTGGWVHGDHVRLAAGWRVLHLRRTQSLQPNTPRALAHPYLQLQARAGTFTAQKQRQSAFCRAQSLPRAA